VKYKIFAYGRPSGELSFSGYFQGDKDGDRLEERKHRITAGLNSSLRATERTLLSINFQTCDDRESRHEARSMVEISLSHGFGNQSRITMRGRRTAYGNIAGKYESALRMEISIPFGLPAARKRTIGEIRGWIYDQESNQPLRDVILRIDNAMAISDKNGNFSFPALEPGVHYLNVSAARIGLEHIPAQKNPLAITVTGGEQTWVELGMARAASVAGQVMRYRHEEKHNAHSSGDGRGDPQVIGQGDQNGCFHAGETGLAEDRGIAGVLVELSNDTDVLSCLTDSEGRFEFEEVRPQEWILKIHDDSLPEYHHFERDLFNFNLEPGQRQEILVRALPKLRPIQIIAEGEIIMEERK
jgi:hypothetical protein